MWDFATLFLFSTESVRQGDWLQLSLVSNGHFLHLWCFAKFFAKYLPAKSSIFKRLKYNVRSNEAKWPQKSGWIKSHFWLSQPNQACDTIFSIRIWCSTTFSLTVWRNSAKWRFRQFFYPLFCGHLASFFRTLCFSQGISPSKGVPESRVPQPWVKASLLTCRKMRLYLVIYTHSDP